MSAPDFPPDTPLAQPPPGSTTDFTDQGYAPTLRDLIIALLVLNTLFTIARVYTRSVVLKAFGIDDGFVIAAWVATTAHMGVTLDSLNYGFGHHIWNIRISGFAHLYRDFFVLEIWSTVVYLTLKNAFLFTYLRIFNPSKVYRWAIWGGIIVVTLFNIGTFWWLLFKCDPIAASWNPFITQKSCANEFVPGGETGVFNVISDIYILILPLPMIWRLQSSLKHRIRLLAIFSVAIFATTTSIVRLAETVIQAKNPDSFYALGRVDIWALLEYSVGLMVVCSLVFAALWNKVLAAPATRIWSGLSYAAQRSMLTLGMQRRSHRSSSDISMTNDNLPITKDSSSTATTAGRKDRSNVSFDETRMV